VPPEIYLLNPSGEDSRVIDFEQADNAGFMCVSRCSNNIYCTLESSTYETVLFEYNMQTSTLTELTILEGYYIGMPFVVVNGYAFYHIEYDTFLVKQITT
jgi:hypothetical protein